MLLVLCTGIADIIVCTFVCISCECIAAAKIKLKWMKFQREKQKKKPFSERLSTFHMALICCTLNTARTHRINNAIYWKCKNYISHFACFPYSILNYYFLLLLKRFFFVLSLFSFHSRYSRTQSRCLVFRCEITFVMCVMCIKSLECADMNESNLYLAMPYGHILPHLAHSMQTLYWKWFIWRFSNIHIKILYQKYEAFTHSRIS